MQYGLKKESIDKVLKGMNKSVSKIEQLKKEYDEAESAISKFDLRGEIEEAELAYSALSHIQESLEEFDFVILDKKDYDLVNRFLI